LGNRHDTGVDHVAEAAIARLSRLSYNLMPVRP
jgi:hypothetical protein